MKIRKMELLLLLKIFVLLWFRQFSVAIMVGNEKSETKSNPQSEKLPWFNNFGPILQKVTDDGTKIRNERQYDDFSSRGLCPSGVTGQFPYTPDCKRFINCWKGRGMIQICAPGTLFNPATGECDYPDKVKCTQSENFSSNPQVLATRFPVSRPPIRENPRISRKDNYQVAPNVRPYPGRPPYFGPSHLTHPQPRPTAVTNSGKEDDVKCPVGGAGLYPHPTDCNKFLNCWGGRMFIQNCGPGTYFNSDMGVCDHGYCGNNESNNKNYDNVPLAKSDITFPTEYKDVNDYNKNNLSSGQKNLATEDIYNSGTNLFEARIKEDNDDEIGIRINHENKTEDHNSNKEFKDVDGEVKRDRDSSWGKILNYNNNRRLQPNSGSLYYDAHGNLVNYNRYWTEAGKPVYFGSRPPQQSQNHKPQNGHQNPGDSNVYFIRPHNHVMNQYPLHFQSNGGSKYPVYYNPQFPNQNANVQPGHLHTHNVFYKPEPIETVVKGHFILVEDNKAIDTKLDHESHQAKEPSRFLLPPRAEENSRISVLNLNDNNSNHDLHHGVEEPSKFLLPPRLDESVKNISASLNHSSRKDPIIYDYSNWKPFYTEKPPVRYDSQTEGQNGFHKIYTHPDLSNSNNNKPTESSIKPIGESNWSKFYENKDPYGLKSIATTSGISSITEPTPLPKKEESTTERVYVVYPVKNFEKDETKNTYYKHYPKYTQNNTLNEDRQTFVHKTKHREKETLEESKKRIKSEIDFDESNESLNTKDVEIYNPSFEDLLPNTKKNIRLKSLSNHLDGYVEIKGPTGEWGLVCDKPNSWMINEANTVCKELGYLRGAQISWQGYPLDSSIESIPVSVSEVNCIGNEETFSDCVLSFGNDDCDITKNAVGLRCFDNVTTQCHPEEVEYNNSCYKLVNRDDFDDKGFSLEEAADYCKKIGGRLTDIVTEEENNFISNWLIDKYPDVRSALTGGIGSAVMGRSLWMWFGSETPMLYQKWWKGWTDEKKIKQGSVHSPLCIVLRKSFPCYLPDENEGQIEIELGNLEPEYCSANYFYWDVEECNKLNELNIPHICKKPLEEIGCVVGRGEHYAGTASITSSGLPCLPWDHPEVKERLSHQITLQEWSTKLAGHNFCRNLGRQELHPWCFVEGKENSEYCAIPQCWDSVPGYSKSARIKSSCDETQFECKPGECVERNSFCDGKRDCSNGRDEAMCNIFLQEFTKVNNKRIKGHGREKWPDISENTCAKLCLENKKFKCRSFSFHNKGRTCHLSETNKGLSGKVITEEGWTYHELSVSSLNCSLSKGLMECSNGKCVNVSNICDGKDNCGDGSDEVECNRLGYQIRLTGSNETNKGRVEVKVLGKWGTICDDKFDMRDGEVVCRELGFKHGVAEILPNSHFPMEKPFFLVDDLECLGNETSIRECNFPGWGKHDCKAEETVGVACRMPDTECSDDEWHCKVSKECIPISYLCDTITDCDDKSDEDEKMCSKPIKIRLAGGPNATAGRLEVQYLGTWGTICDDGFNDEAASVICQIFGFYGPAIVLKNAYFGPGKGPIWLDGVHCHGNETNVDQCVHSLWGKHNCKHDEDVSISCSTHAFKQKSSALKPIAHSSDANVGETPIKKLKKVLLEECSEDGNGTLQSLPFREKLARVVGSNVVPEGIPWQASVRVRSPGGKSSHWCGAVVISPYHILTAGHCLRDYSKPAYFIRVGDFDTEIKDPEEQEFAIDHLYMHPDFNSKVHLNNDIALVKVKGELRLGNRVRPSCLAPSVDIYQPGTNCSISGWGSVSSQSSGFARTLRRAYVPILEPSLCKAPFVYGDNLSDGMFCAGKLDGGIDSCQGDSGGPMMCEHEGKQYLFGITSWGHGCGRPNKPGVYTKVAYYTDWIQEKIKISLN